MNHRFITFEGGEGAGKTTLIDALEKMLISQGHSVLKVREPGGTCLGEAIRSLLLHHEMPISPYAELSLFLASRAQHISEIIGQALAEGKIVLCDRFNDSTIAYQGAARGLGMEEVAAFCRFICQGLEPDLTLYLDIDPKIGLQRASARHKSDRIEAEGLAFHIAIREAFLAIHRKNPSRVCLLDANQPPEQVFQQAILSFNQGTVK